MCPSSRYRIKVSTSAKGSTKSFPCFIYDPWTSSCMRTVNSLLLRLSYLSACTQDFMPAQDSKGHLHSLDSVSRYFTFCACLKHHIFLDKNVKLVILLSNMGVTNYWTLLGSKQMLIILVTWWLSREPNGGGWPHGHASNSGLFDSETQNRFCMVKHTLHQWRHGHFKTLWICDFFIFFPHTAITLISIYYIISSPRFLIITSPHFSATSFSLSLPSFLCITNVPYHGTAC